jgi:hypothetical protein
MSHLRIFFAKPPCLSFAAPSNHKVITGIKSPKMLCIYTGQNYGGENVIAFLIACKPGNVIYFTSARIKMIK